MTIGIHQPNFLPWFGYFLKIFGSDHFVLLDHVQFSKGSFTNRNKIVDKSGKQQWMTIPIKGQKLESAINQIEVDYNARWHIKLPKTLQANYAGAPYFKEMRSTIFDIFEEQPTHLSNLNCKLIIEVSRLLEIETTFSKTSELSIENERNEMLVNICKHFKADTYLAGKGSKNYEESELFRSAGIELRHLEFDYPNYDQGKFEFVPNLSILDMLFYAGKDKIIRWLRDSHS